MRIAYLTGEYPRVTDTFIQREVAALRQQGEADGTTVHTFSVRPPKTAQPPRSPEATDKATGAAAGQASGGLSAAQQKERDRTSYLLPVNPFELLLSHWLLLTANPRRYLQALALAWQTRQLGIRGTLYQLIYFLEAGVLSRRLKKQTITHLHNHFGDSSCTVAMLAAALSGIPYSFTLHGPGIFFEPYRWRLDEKISRAKFVSCISYFCRSQTMIFAPWHAWENLHIVHCGVDPQQFKPSGLDASGLDASGLEPSDIRPARGSRLVYVGRLAAAKGLPILLQSMAALKLTYEDVQLTVVGDGSDRAELEARAASLELSDRIDFVGYQSPAAVRQYLRAADVFVMSSFAEGVPVVLMEAMMTGLPVVATQIAGVSELVEESVNGYLVPPSDVEALTDRLGRLLSDGELRQRLGDRGQQKVAQDFNIHHEAEKLYQLIAPAPSAAIEPVSDEASRERPKYFVPKEAI